MSRPAENPQSEATLTDGLAIVVSNLFGRRKRSSQSGRVRIKKRPKSLSERRRPWQAFSDGVDGFERWLKCFFSRRDPAYRKVYFGALWGEMGEYGIRLSTLASIAYIAGALYVFRYLPKMIERAAILGKTPPIIRPLIAVVLLVVGLNQLRDLGGPIWWADRYAATQALNARSGKEVKRYECYDMAMTRQLAQRHEKKFPLKSYELARLGELYRQFYHGDLSAESWDELGKYTKTQVDFFYQTVGIDASEPRFPESALKQPESAPNPPAAA